MREAHLRDLIAVFDSGSVRAAARTLGISQAAVSKNLSALERSLGVPLLLRTPHGVEPTDYGRLVLRRARAVDTEMRRLQEEIAGAAGARLACVSVGLSATAEALLLPSALTRFAKSCPGVLVSMAGGRSNTNIAALREGRIDFAIAPASGEAQASDLHFERLLSSDMVVVARSGHRRQHAARLQDLQDVQWLVPLRQPAAQSPLVGAFAAEGLPPPPVAAHCDSPSALVNLLIGTDLVTLTPRDALLPFCRAGLLAVLPVTLGLPPLVQQLITSASHPLTPTAQTLASEFRKASRHFRR